MTQITAQDLIDFVYNEAALLDQLHFESWLDLFTDDAYYWMPLAHGQTDPILHGSLMYEDKLLLKIRVERLTGQRTFSQQPKSRCHHLLQRPEVKDFDAKADEHIVRTAFHYTETRDDTQTIYVGWVTHHLVNENNQLRIRLKRVDLLNCDAPFSNIQLFM